MRGEPDFEAYVAARSGSVVRGLELLGHGPAQAEEAASATLARLRRDWHDVRESADPDVALWSQVLADESRRRRRSREEPLDEAAVAVVLREGVALEELQVCELLGVSTARLRSLVSSRPPRGPDDAQTAYALPYSRVRRAVGRQRRRRWLVTGGVAAVTALAVGVGAWWSRPEPVSRPGDALPPVAAKALVNGAGVVWWADGDLHLAGSVLHVGDVRRLVAAGDGAAYVDARGRLVGVTPDGRRTLLGHPAERSPLVSSPRLGLVAWADASEPGVTRLVVWDAEDGRVGAVVTSPGVRPVTFDGGWLRFGQGLQDWAWDPSGGPAQLTGDGFADDPNERTALVDAVAGTRLEQWGTHLRVVRSGSREETVFSGFGGSLSADGRLVLTGPEQNRDPRLYDARTGEPLAPPRPGWRFLSAAFVESRPGESRVSWLADQGGGELVIITCETRRPARCPGYTELGRAERVVLAADSRR